MIFDEVVDIYGFDTEIKDDDETTADSEENEETTLPFDEDDKKEPVQPVHSKYYIEGLSVDEVITYFSEVVLDSEFSFGGNPQLVQKWSSPIYYVVHGTYTNDDMIKLNEMVEYLNSIDGFPGIKYSNFDHLTNLNIYFLNSQEYISKNSDNAQGTDGFVTFWYNGESSIYKAEISYRNDIDQHTRNSVILEEIYNGIGPAQDTDLRLDSLIYSGFSTPQHLTEIDKLILELLYDPSIKCGMNASQCEQVIRLLYY